MYYVRQKPALELVEGSDRARHFASILTTKRPGLDEMKAFERMYAELASPIWRSSMRSVCPITWLGVFADKQGVWLIAEHRDRQKVSHGQTAIATLLASLREDVRDNVTRGVLQLDALHAKRIQAWRTVEELRPVPMPPMGSTLAAFKAYNADMREDELVAEEEAMYERRKAQEAKERRWAMGDVSSDDEADAMDVEEPLDSAFALARPDATPQPLALRSPRDVWIKRAREESVIAIFEVGERPSVLQYRRLHREERRASMMRELMLEASSQPDLSHAYQAAHKLMQAGDLPAYVQKRKLHALREFCKEVVLSLDSSAETEVAALPFLARQRIAEVLGNSSLAFDDGCYWLKGFAVCPGKANPRWLTRDRKPWDGREKTLHLFCGHCGWPAVWGRLTQDIHKCLLFAFFEGAD